MISAASTGDEAAFSTAPAQIEAAAAGGHPGTQSALAFLTGAGMTCPVSRSRAFLLHKFAADVGDLQSKMALAYSYFRQEKRWWKSECWTDCYTIILCTTVWIFWKGLGHGLLYEITEGHASIKNQKIPEMRWHFILASFRLQKTVPELEGNTSKLELDIYTEVAIPNSIVVVNLLHPLAGSNWTNVVFSIVPYPKNLTISSTWLSILRSSFMSLVVRQSTFHLTRSLFGNSSSFEVLKFPGGITIIPPQNAFLPQAHRASFNFTLNFPIYKVQDRTDELKDQMKTGLLINANENLFIKLVNLQGSTVLPPTIVETYIVRVVGNHQPSVPRMKQLAQKITNSSSGNLGLNHTVFGKVKQIRLSSYLRHSLHSRGSSDAPSPSPNQHHGHHGHHHHHHGHEGNRHLAPAPINFPAHTPKYVAPPPSGCPYGKKAKNKVPVTPAAEPVANDHRSAYPAASPPSSVHHPPRDPSMHSISPVPSPPVLPEPPLPAVSFGDAHPPSERATGTGPSAGMLHVAPAPQTSNARRTHSCHWLLVVLLICCTLLRSLL